MDVVCPDQALRNAFVGGCPISAARDCGDCGEILDKDCFGNEHCPECDGPCSGCAP